jgi:methylmalonyl-CoA mutase
MFLPRKGEEDEVHDLELIRSTESEKKDQIDHVRRFQDTHEEESEGAIARLKDVARRRGNVFEELMHTVKSNSLGQISAALYEVGGEYRRNM